MKCQSSALLVVMAISLVAANPILNIQISSVEDPVHVKDEQCLRMCETQKIGCGDGSDGGWVSPWPTLIDALKGQNPR